MRYVDSSRPPGCFLFLSAEEAWANRDPGQYAKTDEAYDVRMLSFLIDRLLLGRAVAFPVEGENRPDSVLRHQIVGHARANDED